MLKWHIKRAVVFIALEVPFFKVAVLELVFMKYLKLYEMWILVFHKPY